MSATTSVALRQLRVMVVGGGPHVLPRVEPLLPAGAYDVEFVGLDEEPYGCILDDAPDLLVVCLRIEDTASFAFLSILQCDPATRGFERRLLHEVESVGACRPERSEGPALHRWGELTPSLPTPPLAL